MNIVEYLNEAARHYYNGNPIISDEVFDRLAASCYFNNIGARQHENVQKHYFPMYSLKKYYEDEGKVNPLEGESDVAFSHKLDGAAISLLYVNGELIRGLTRGDGVEGTDITEKLRSCSLVPHTIRHEGILQVTGEVAAPKHIPNARNYAAGSLNLKDSSEFKTRALEFFAYGIQPYFYPTWEEDMDLLTRIGFKTVKESELDKVYPTDGIVFRVNSNARFEELGYTANYPRGAYARKERPEGAVTPILDVVWQVGKSGKVTPVAILEPILLGDATVSRATLNNPGFIEALDVQIGDQVHVIRSGEIIPCITHKVE